MGIGRILASEEGNEGVELPAEETRNKGRSSRRNRRRQKRTTRVQQLYDACKQVFASVVPGIVPPPSEIQRLKTILDEMTEDDVGLKPEMPYLLRNNEADGLTPMITYLHIYECRDFSIGIFCLPPTSVIPLHNHPQMTVLSKLLFGTMHIKSYDWVDTKVPSNVNIVGDGVGRLAKLKVNGVFTAPCETSILYPADGGNIHCFTAITSCAVLDVLGPPYSGPEGRHCTYYLEYPLAVANGDVADDDAADGGAAGGPAGSDDLGEALPREEDSSSMVDSKTHAWLKERKDNPEELIVVGGFYSGPAIKEK